MARRSVRKIMGKAPIERSNPNPVTADHKKGQPSRQINKVNRVPGRRSERLNKTMRSVELQIEETAPVVDIDIDESESESNESLSKASNSNGQLHTYPETDPSSEEVNTMLSNQREAKEQESGDSTKEKDKTSEYLAGTSDPFQFVQNPSCVEFERFVFENKYAVDLVSPKERLWNKDLEQKYIRKLMKGISSETQTVLRLLAQFSLSSKATARNSDERGQIGLIACLNMGILCEAPSFLRQSSWIEKFFQIGILTEARSLLDAAYESLKYEIFNSTGSGDNRSPLQLSTTDLERHLSQSISRSEDFERSFSQNAIPSEELREELSRIAKERPLLYEQLDDEEQKKFKTLEESFLALQILVNQYHKRVKETRQYSSGQLIEILYDAIKFVTKYYKLQEEVVRCRFERIVELHSFLGPITAYDTMLCLLEGSSLWRSSMNREPQEL